MFKLTKKAIEIGGFDISNLPVDIYLRKDEYKEISTFIHYKLSFRKNLNLVKGFYFETITGYMKEGSGEFIKDRTSTFISSKDEITALDKFIGYLKNNIEDGYVKDIEMYIGDEKEFKYYINGISDDINNIFNNTSGGLPHIKLQTRKSGIVKKVTAKLANKKLKTKSP